MRGGFGADAGEGGFEGWVFGRAVGMEFTYDDDCFVGSCRWGSLGLRRRWGVGWE